MELSEELLARLRSEAGTWRSRLMLTATKEPRGNLANALTALREAPEWEGVLAHDDFALTIMSLRPPPWCSGTNSAWAPRTWADSDDLLACEWLQRQGISVQAGTASQAVFSRRQRRCIPPNTGLPRWSQMGRHKAARDLRTQISRHGGNCLSCHRRSVHVRRVCCANRVSRMQRRSCADLGGGSRQAEVNSDRGTLSAVVLG